MVAATSPLQELLEAARDAKKVEVFARLDFPRGKWLEVRIDSTLQSNGNRSCWIELTENTAKQAKCNYTPAAGIDVAIRLIATTYPKSQLVPESIAVKVQKGPMGASKLRPIAVQAWHEALGLPIPTLEEVAEQVKATKSARQSTAEVALAQLKAGTAGVKAFNQRPERERQGIDLRKADLSGCQLDGVHFEESNLEGADLSGASLTKAMIPGSQMKGARLVGADLTGAKIGRCRGADADFSRARLRGTWLVAGSYLRAKFLGADLTGANLIRADLRGTDFTDAILDELDFDMAKFDQDTRWPEGFQLPAELIWKGTGPDPRHLPLNPAPTGPKPTDFAGFLDRLNDVADPAKLDKAMRMLKAERFQLFARVEPDHLVGVVKSQSDPDLVYSCRLAEDGAYACCTQNLNICGGLRGSPCKHLYVLIVGLAKAGELDPGSAHDWIESSRGQKPKLDKDAMAETFLKYKGAEAGDIDWRPTETLPEDFYAM